MAVELIRHSDSRLDPAAAGAVPEQLSARRAADDRRALGVAQHAEAGAHREPAAAGRGAAARRARAAAPPIATSRAPDDGRGIAVAARRAPDPAFIVQLLHRVREYGAATCRRSASPSTTTWRRGRPTAEETIRGEHQRQGVAQVSVANAITSLRLCATLDWQEYVESVSLVEQVLQRDPAGAYGRMDFLSRDQQRQAVEELAEPTRRGPGARGPEGGRERAPGRGRRVDRRPRGPRRLSPGRSRAAPISKPTSPTVRARRAARPSRRAPACPGLLPRRHRGADGRPGRSAPSPMRRIAGRRRPCSADRAPRAPAGQRPRHRAASSRLVTRSRRADADCRASTSRRRARDARARWSSCRRC